jgi:hypothetical protein
MISGFVVHGATLTSVIRIRSDESKSSSFSQFFDLFAMGSSALEALGDVKEVMDPLSLQCKMYNQGAFGHFSTTPSVAKALQTTQDLWRLASTVQPQAQKIANVFSGNPDLKQELHLLRACTQLFFAKNKTVQEEVSTAISFIPQLIDESHSKWHVVRALSLMGFTVTPSTFAGSSVLYDLATILVTTPLDVWPKVSQNTPDDSPGLRKLILKTMQQIEGLEDYSVARRVAVTVWKLWMRNRGESAYDRWVCSYCKKQNDNADLNLDADDHSTPTCQHCPNLQPSSGGWSCRKSDCKYRLYDVKNEDLNVHFLTCLVCTTPRGMSLGSWACPTCTFHNKVHHPMCEMCSSPKPRN